ncbi:metallophosphoesterase [filamentous cyanobacterium CCP2]|nr:metallophosphoesterase [filamentous cyanobacterium CCP2]
MKFVSEPSTTVKMQKMKQRVRWQDPAIRERGIDQTEFIIDDGQREEPEFSFMVVGDSGTGKHLGESPQRQIAEMMLEHREECRFVLHTGDVIYLVGSSEYYPSNFIKPYREFLVGGENPNKIQYDRMVFNLPFLPVPGNHDYYDLPVVYGALSLLSMPVRRLFRAKVDLDVGWHGSWQGKAYAKAFLDYLAGIGTPEEFATHLDRHYVAYGSQGRCLRYQPSQFTRLPNRYYTFRYGGIDFFALDSNTFNDPAPLGNDKESVEYRQMLEKRRVAIEQEKLEIMERSAHLNPNNPEEADQLDDLRTKLELLEENENDIDKQLDTSRSPDVDKEQLAWLEQRLIESWNTDAVRGRVIYFHHPPYVTEATKWDQAQTLAVRYRLRKVLDNVAKVVGQQAENRSIVDLVLNGHAHCLEYLRTIETGHADSNINWIVCGGSGYSLRRQREEGAELFEAVPEAASKTHLVAKSHLFVGRTGHGSDKHRPYSFVRIDVTAGSPPKFVVRPMVAERHRSQWSSKTLPAFEIE